MQIFQRKLHIFLGLQESECFTGHSFRVTSATVLADSGANNLVLKRHGRWKSDAIAEGYVRNSSCNQMETAHMLAGSSIQSSHSNSTFHSNISFTNCVFSGTVTFPDK